MSKDELYAQMDRVNDLEDILDRIKERHFLHPAFEPEGLCEECSWRWPCPTTRLIQEVDSKCS